MTFNLEHAHAPGLVAIVDVFDDHDLFETLDNEQVRRLSQLGGRPGFSGERAILKSTGIAKRRILSKGTTPVEVGVRAIRRLEAKTGCELAEFDHVLLCHSHVDPTECQRLAAQLCQRFGLSNSAIAAFNHGCGGFLKLLEDGQRLLADQPHAKVCLLSVETPEFWHDASDRLFCGIVSAGATAAVLENDRGLLIGHSNVDDFKIPTDRRPNQDPLFHKDTCDGFDFREQPIHRTVMRMNPEPVFLNGIELMLNNLREALAAIGHQSDQRIIVAPHQPSAKLLKALVAAAKPEFPDIEFLNNLRGFGNTISSTVPTCVTRLEEIMDRQEIRPLRDGDVLVLLAAGICMNDIADSMSAGFACLQWKRGALNVTTTVEASAAV